MYVTFTKAKKHRVLSYKEIFQLHHCFTLNIAIFAYLIFICNCMHKWLLIQVSIMTVTDIILHQWLSIPEYLHKKSKSMHIKVIVIETTSC